MWRGTERRIRFLQVASGFLATVLAGIGQALQQNPDFPYYLPRNEQAMVHTAVAFSKMNNRLRTFACTSSIGPGATNMVTGAATATINRIPVLLPSQSGNDCEHNLITLCTTCHASVH